MTSDRVFSGVLPLQEAPAELDAFDDPTILVLPDEPDEVLVERIIAGLHRVPLNVKNCVELHEAIRRLAASGNPDDIIAARIGRATNTVCRMRLRLGIPNGSPRYSRKVR